MIKILITGSIGVGKTTVCKVFEELGISVYYSDLEAKKIMDTNPIDFEIVSEDMQSFRYKLIYRGEVIYDNETTEYVHATVEP